VLTNQSGPSGQICLTFSNVKVSVNVPCTRGLHTPTHSHTHPTAVCVARWLWVCVCVCVVDQCLTPQLLLSDDEPPPRVRRRTPRTDSSDPPVTLRSTSLHLRPPACILSTSTQQPVAGGHSTPRPVDATYFARTPSSYYTELRGFTQSRQRHNGRADGC